MLDQILEQFGINPSNHQIEECGFGLINRTWKIHGERDYILQKINTDIFQRQSTGEKTKSLTNLLLKK